MLKFMARRRHRPGSNWCQPSPTRCGVGRLASSRADFLAEVDTTVEVIRLRCNDDPELTQCDVVMEIDPESDVGNARRSASSQTITTVTWPLARIATGLRPGAESAKPTPRDWSTFLFWIGPTLESVLRSGVPPGCEDGHKSPGKLPWCCRDVPPPRRWRRVPEPGRHLRLLLGRAHR